MSSLECTLMRISKTRTSIHVPESPAKGNDIAMFLPVFSMCEGILPLLLSSITLTICGSAKSNACFFSFLDNDGSYAKGAAVVNSIIFSRSTVTIPHNGT